MEAKVHPSQDDRLAALTDYGILDTPREAEFDEIVALASAICDTPIALISLVDDRRAWFKAEIGIGMREVPISQSVCVHALLEGDFFEIPDTLADPRTRDNPLVTGEPGFRFYAGAVLRTTSGLPMGMLCVLDKRPRQLEPLQVETLRVLARQVMLHMDLRIARKREDMLRREVDHRVKNSLTSVGALVRIQRRAAVSSDTREALGTILSRIESVAALHQMISGSDHGEAIELGDYLGRVARLQSESKPAGVELVASFAPVLTDAVKAAAAATIVNELCANAFKHAFPEGRRGRVELTGKVVDRKYVITCADDGIGTQVADAGTLPVSANGGIGHLIIEASVNQLAGQIMILPRNPGISMSISFPN